MNVFKRAQVQAVKIAVDVSDNATDWKVGEPVRFPDQWRDGVRITGIITEVLPFKDGCRLRIRPITEKGARREFYATTQGGYVSRVLPASEM